jgi:hypothetical protein
MKITCQARLRAFLLIDCIVYCLLFFIILGLAFTAFYQITDHSKRLNRSASDISRALSAGEHWRADIRSATAAPKLSELGSELILVVPQNKHEVTYVLRRGTVFRRSDAGAPWLDFLPGVEKSKMEADQRKKVHSWRWELELKTDSKKVYTKPVFTFQAVPKGGQNL